MNDECNWMLKYGITQSWSNLSLNPITLLEGLITMKMVIRITDILAEL